MQDLVVHVDDEVVSAHSLELAVLLAAEWGSRLTVVAATTPVTAGVGLSAETAALSVQLGQAQQEALLAIGERLVASARQRHAGPIDLRVANGDPVEALLTHTRTADLLITSQRGPNDAGGLSTAQSARLLVGAACPVLAVPFIGLDARHADPAAGGPLRKALVAWADTRESARAVRDALPLLQRASHVDLVSFAESGRDDAMQASLQRVADYLARHGVQATMGVLNQAEPSLGERMRRGWVPDVGVAEALLSRAADLDADLIVMGAYGHARLWELVLGGVTRTILKSMTVPVLMSH
jgi:nucleotide-binding universal stress UspA family protein